MQKCLLTTVLLFLSIVLLAQDGNAGLNEANTKVRSYFQAGTNLMYAVGAIVGLIGAIKSVPLKFIKNGIPVIMIPARQRPHGLVPVYFL
jgi:hypothetical protein